MLHFKHSEGDTEGVVAQIEEMNGKMVLKFDRPVDAIQVTLEDITALITFLVQAGFHLHELISQQSAPRK